MSRNVCVPAFAGNELYLNGLSLGTTSIQRALSTTAPSRLMNRASRAAGDTPIIGDTGISFAGAGSVGSSSASSAYCDQRPAVRVAHQHQGRSAPIDLPDVAGPHAHRGGPSLPR